jgi:hypothetical protein
MKKRHFCIHSKGNKEKERERVKERGRISVRESNHNDYNVSVVKKEKSETKRAGSVRVNERERQ